jgi:hypothetical protein
MNKYNYFENSPLLFAQSSYSFHIPGVKTIGSLELSFSFFLLCFFSHSFFSFVKKNKNESGECLLHY